MNTQIKIDTWHYDVVSRVLHWIIAICVIGMISVGLYMTSIADQPGARTLINLHKSFGIIVGGLVLVRVIWRLLHKPAPLPASVAPWQVKVAHLVHFLLYACIIIMPLSGFLGASFSSRGIVFFGLPLPAMVPPNPEISKLLFTMHIVVAWTLITLLSLHVLAALKHLMIDRDGVFQRMWF